MDALIVASRFLHVAALALLSALGWLIGVAADMSGSFAQAFAAETLTAVLSETRFGQVWLARLALAAALFAWMVLPASAGRRGDIVTLALAAALTASLAGVGHAATGALAPLHVAADAAHLLAAAAWVGGLFALAAALRAGRAAQGRAAQRRDADMPALLARFSRLGTVAVAVLVLSGLVNTALILPGPAALLATVYGRVLLIKLALVATMIALAALNRLVLTPRIAQGNAGTAALTKSVALEQALGLAVLAAVARLGTLAPAG
jgi:putative copper resistance protein D